MKRKNIFGLLTVAWLLVAGTVFAQAEALAVGNTSLVERQDVYGQPLFLVEGRLANNGPDAYTTISLLAEVYDAEGGLIGEGIGYLVNACGAGLLPDFALQPGSAQRFAVQLELYEPEAAIAGYEIIPQGAAVAPVNEGGETLPGVTRISNEEVVAVEWLDSRALRYGAGCAEDLFTELDWTQYSMRTGVALPVIHPRADDVTPALLRALGLDEPALIENSAIRFSPAGTRLVYQGEANRIGTAELNGAFRRTLSDEVYNRTLQGIYWLRGNNFVAYYYGAYGDPVIYFTAHESGQRISLGPLENLPSEIVPGVSPDGRRGIIAGTFGDERGYFLKALINNSAPQLLFEAEPPGNNWPPPLFVSGPAAPQGDSTSEIIYVARPVEGEARLQCFDLSHGGPRDLGPLPLKLRTDEQARWWLAPDGRTIALAANGVNGGLWLIDLPQSGECASRD